MIRFAPQNAAGAITRGIGVLYGRSRSPSHFRSAANDTGANAYMIAVASVTSPTTEAQLGNGRNTISPMTNASRIDQLGTPRLLVSVSLSGSASSFPSAYDRRADEPR